MTTFAIGDIHGNLAALESLLERLVPDLDNTDTLVFLGDYIDRGPDSKGCIEAIVQLEEEAPFSVVALLGNHEAWMLATMDDYGKHSWLLGAEAFETVASYSREAETLLRREVESAGPRLITDDVDLSYAAFFDAMPEKHRRFFRSLRLYHCGDGAVFVHAGIDPDGGALEEQDARELTWGLCHEFPDGYRGPSKVVYGHRDNSVPDESGWPQPFIRDELTYGIDTISTGVLTAIGMPYGKIVQSERF